MKLVEDMYTHLLKNEKNVVLIHCNSGKGRAGTATTCLLFYMGLYS
jgi:hypothetical protein